MKQFKIKTKQTILKVKQPQYLIQFLQDKMGGMTRNSVHLILSHRQVSVNGIIQTKYNYLLNEGDEVLITTGEISKELNHPKIKIVYEDNYLIVVEKKEGLLTVATYEGSREVTCFSLLKKYVRQRNPRAGIYVVHRLDRETSGLLVFAKSEDIQHYMRDYWHQLVTKRTYIALAEGKFSKLSDTIITWFTEDKKTTMVYSSPIDDGGKKAVTHYKVIKQNEEYSLVELHLETGRTNQIRVHLASIGHPIVGDRKYGSNKPSKIDRLALHAIVLEFIHPITEQIVHFETSIPKIFTIK